MVSFTYFFAFCFGYVRWRIFAWEHFFLNWCLGIKNGNKLLYESEINRLFHTILKQYLESYVTVMENAEWAINKLGFIWYNFPEFYNFLFSVFQCFDTCFIGIEGSKNCFTRNIAQFNKPFTYMALSEILCKFPEKLRQSLREIDQLLKSLKSRFVNVISCNSSTFNLWTPKTF